MTTDLVRLKNNCGTTEANISGVSYGIHSDGAFYVPERVAHILLYEPPCGFYLAEAVEHCPPPGSVSLVEIEAMIYGVEDGPVKTALLAALDSAPSPAPSGAPPPPSA